MNPKIVKIELFNSDEGVSSVITVEELSENRFKTIENELLDFRLTYGTEFETRLNQNGKHEVVRLTKKSEFITRRFFLNSQFRESEYRLLGDEIMRQGGFWQVDFGSIATVNLPPNNTLNLDEILKVFGFESAEMID